MLPMGSRVAQPNGRILRNKTRQCTETEADSFITCLTYPLKPLHDWRLAHGGDLNGGTESALS
jgi:hypothetical protein